MRKAHWILVAASELALAGCGFLGKDEHGYPETVKQNFLTACVKAKATQATCNCALAGIEKTISYDKFAEADAAMKANKPLDPAFEQQMSKLVMQCAKAQ